MERKSVGQAGTSGYGGLLDSDDQERRKIEKEVAAEMEKAQQAAA